MQLFPFNCIPIYTSHLDKKREQALREQVQAHAAQLMEAQLKEAQLKEAQLKEAQLKEAWLLNEKLQNSLDLTGKDLDLIKKDLDLTGKDLEAEEQGEFMNEMQDPSNCQFYLTGLWQQSIYFLPLLKLYG